MTSHDENPRTEPRRKASVRGTDNDLQQSPSSPSEGNDPTALDGQSGTGATESRPRGHTEDPDRTL